MTCIKAKLESLCFEVESQVKNGLKGFFGGMVSRFLPQTWVFKTESETVTFKVDPYGNTSVKTGAGSRPDVTLEIDHEYLSTALTTRRQPPFPYKKFNIIFHTQKGETAFNFLRKRLGL